jgi:large subunit ribosomal protein L25
VLLDDDALIVNVTHAPTAQEVEEELAEAEAEVGIERDESDESIAEGVEAEAAEAAESSTDETSSEEQ